MPLQTLQLDKLNWQQMVTAIQGRIIPNSNAKWTLQAPVDPGVTLVELFAWLLDQRIYWLGQTPDSLVLAILSLLGQAPQSAQAAVTVMQLSDAAQPPRALPIAQAGTLMRLGDINPPILFTLDEDLALLPCQGISVVVNGSDRTNDLLQKRLVPLLAHGQNTSQVRFLFQLNQNIAAGSAGQFVSIFLELFAPADVYPQWSASEVPDIAAPAMLSWSYTSTSGNAAVTLGADQVDDGTAGLRRPGIVRFALPVDWQPESAGNDPSIITYGLTLNIAGAGYTYTPQLTSVAANVVLAHHQWPRSAPVTPANWPPLPGNTISLPVSPANSAWKEYPPIEDSVRLTITGRDGSPTQWTAVPDLDSYGPTDNVFVIDRARAQIRFGDGLTGRLPVLSAAANPPITVTYMAGGGLAGNVGANSAWAAVQADLAAPNLFFTGVNLSPGDGGAESETLLQAQQRSEASLNDRNRAVTQSDYEILAITTTGVAIRRAYAAVGYDPDFPCATVAGAVTVFIVPYAPRTLTDTTVPPGSFVPAPRPDSGAIAAVSAQLSAGKLLGGQFFVSAPVYRKVWLALKIAVDFPLTPAQRQAILTGLQTYLDPLVGGDEQNGWPFGDPLRPSALLKQAQDILGELGDMLSVGISLTGPQDFEACGDTTIHAHELVYLVHADLATQQRAAQGGGLR
jgi:hypothetical protein